VLLKALTPAVPHCTAIVAEPSDLPDARTPAFREIASYLLASVSPLLASDRSPSGEIVAALREPWARAGGDPGVLAAATDRFVVLRTSTQETIEVIRAVESRRPSAQEERLASDGAISYTQLETFKACPHRFYLRYVAGMPSPPSRRTTAIGTAFHHAIATEAARRGSGKSVDEAAVRGWFETEVRQTAGDDAPSAGGGRDFVGNYLASPDATAEPLLIEEAFSLKFGETILRGVVDRVHRLPDGSTEVVDYKTDRVARSEAEVRAGWQLPIYLIACREVFKEIQPAPARAVMFFVRANARIGVTYSDAELTTIQREIELTAVQLREVKPGEHKASEGACRQCEYRSICRFKV
jgi:RecB family exonuclease